ncbi:MAG: hypothetical protein IH857_07860 [Deltaproteobacteria bacterium]|nr:hypothetical protein [Deltaproteobacteria bacterium]
MNSLVTKQRLHQWAALGLQAYEAWDQAWPGIQQEVENQGLKILCKMGCVPCCYTRKSCTASEAAAIVEFIAEHFTPEEGEECWMRVESNASSLRRLRANGHCESADTFARAGGLECPYAVPFIPFDL